VSPSDLVFVHTSGFLHWLRFCVLGHSVLSLGRHSWVTQADPSDRRAVHQFLSLPWSQPLVRWSYLHCPLNSEFRWTEVLLAQWVRHVTVDKARTVFLLCVADQCIWPMKVDFSLAFYSGVSRLACGQNGHRSDADLDAFSWWCLGSDPKLAGVVLQVL
jgi:hypothetical protein